VSSVVAAVGLGQDHGAVGHDHGGEGFDLGLAERSQLGVTEIGTDAA
jgi:hypothetical protein